MKEPASPQRFAIPHGQFSGVILGLSYRGFRVVGMEDQLSAYPPLPEAMALLGEVPELARAWEHQVRSRQAQAATIGALLAHTHRVVTELCTDPKVLRGEAQKAAMHDAAKLLGVSELTATTILNAARFARDYLPATWEAFHQGAIDLVRVRKIVEVASDVEDRVLPRLDEPAAQAATTRSMGDLTQWLTRYVTTLDAQAHQRLQETRYRDRSVRCEHYADGMSLITA